MGSDPEGIPHSFPMGARTPLDLPSSEFVKSIEKTIRGKRDGITVCKHISTPDMAPDRAVLLSKMRMSMVGKRK